MCQIYHITYFANPNIPTGPAGRTRDVKYMQFILTVQFYNNLYQQTDSDLRTLGNLERTDLLAFASQGRVLKEKKR